MKCKNKMAVFLICMILIVNTIPFQFEQVYAASNIVDIAKGEIGVSGRPNKYTKWNGAIAESGYSYPWCQAFASWCANQAGLPIIKTASCAEAVKWFKNNGKWESRSGGYVPQAGDFIYFDWGNNGGYDHVGIVDYVSNGRVHTIEGNAKDAVKYDGGYSNGYSITSSEIIGYGKMEAISSPSQPDKKNEIFACIDEVSAGMNCIKIKGWAFDRAFMSRQVEVHVYIGDQCYSIMANQYYKSVDDYYKCGEYHGISAEIPIEQEGEYTVRIFAITPETNQNPMLGDIKTVNVISDHEKPIISNITVSNVSSQGYTVNCEVTDNVGVNRVQFPTWTEYGGQDDVLPEWTQSSEASGVINGNKVSFRVNTSSHNNETGTYITHIYAYDNANNVAVDSVKVVLNNGLTPIAVSHLDGHIYAVFNEAYSWNEAEDLCESMGGHLATITSKKENDFIKTLLGENFYYIGANDKQTEGQWKWVTDEEFSYTNWEEGQPDNAFSNEHFLMIYPDGTWNDLTSKYPNTGFVLEIDNMEIPVSTIAENGSVYEIYDVSVPWEIAEEYCEMKGGTLVCITSEKEEKIVEKLIERGKKRNYQLGATDKGEEGNWKWITGEEISYNLWTQGEPNNRSGSEAPGPENYLTFIRENGWYDMKSFPSDSGFILEKMDDASLELSVSSLTFDLAENPTQTVNVTAVGKLPSSYTFSASKDVNVFNTQWGDWDGDCSSYLIIAKKIGEYTINFNLLDKTNGTTVIATKSIPVTVKCSHKYSAKKIDSTCEEEGYTLHTCSLCQNSYKDSYTSKKEHRYGSWENVRPATCTEDGIYMRTCLDCGVTETKSTVATGHHFDTWDTIKNPTCTTKGTKIRKCIQCGIQETADIEPLKHQYHEEVIESTTTTQGYTLHTCINCGDSYKDNYKDAIEPPQKTETEHHYGEWEIIKPVTCTENGMKRRACLGCGETETWIIVALGHNYSLWEVTKSATCIEDGIQTRNCLDCGETETKSITAAGHQYREEVIEPTTTTQGYTLHTCTTCGYSYEDNYKEAIEPPQDTLIKYGDVNGDGDVNIMDGIIIKKYLAHISVTINKLNSDVNCDNDVNVQDAVLLLKYLAKMNVILGKKLII